MISSQLQPRCSGAVLVSSMIMITNASNAARLPVKRPPHCALCRPLCRWCSRSVQPSPRWSPVSRGQPWAPRVCRALFPTVAQGQGPGLRLGRLRQARGRRQPLSRAWACSCPVCWANSSSLALTRSKVARLDSLSTAATEQEAGSLQWRVCWASGLQPAVGVRSPAQGLQHTGAGSVQLWAGARS